MRVNKLVNEMVKAYVAYTRAKAPNMRPPNFLILGPPGIGKTEGTMQAAEIIAQRLGLKLVHYDDMEGHKLLRDRDKYFVVVDFRLTEVQNSDLIGVPRTEDGYAVFKPLLWAWVLRQGKGMLVLDEITNVQDPSVIAASYKILGERKAGWIRLSNETMIVAMGNEPEHSSIANELPAPLVSRVTLVELDPPTVDEWASYMNRNYQGMWDTRVLAFLKRFPEDFIETSLDVETLTNYPCPRNYTRTAIDLKMGLDQRMVCIGNLGPAVGEKLNGFLKVQIPSVQELLRDPVRFNELNLDQKYLCTIELAEYTGKDPRLVSRDLINLLDTIGAENREFLAVYAITISNVSRKSAAVLERIIDMDEKMNTSVGDYLVEIIDAYDLIR